MHPPSKAYTLLLARLGPQGWWPVTPKGLTRPRYHPGRFARPKELEAFEIAVGAILTQNTAWTNVEKAISELHVANALRPHRLRSLSSGHLGRLIRSSGYFRQKATKIKAFVGRLLERGGRFNEWLSGSLDVARDDLLQVKGIGPETADSILLYAGFRPAFVVDAYTIRIGSRMGWFDDRASYDEVQAYLIGRLPRSVKVYQEFHALIVALAKFFCRKEPVCLACPLRRGCSYGSENKTFV